MTGAISFRLIFVFFSVLPTDHCLQHAIPLGDHYQIADTKFEAKFKQGFYQKFIGTDSSSELRRLQVAKKIGKTQRRIEGPFPCGNARSFRSKSRPSSVHRLMPGDFDLVAAMGDSLAAGMGATASTPFGSLVENRGFSSCIGGFGEWRDFLTVPNILKEFNPRIFGFSTGDSTAADKEAGFNVAEPGALSHQMIHQAKVLVQRIKDDPRVHFNTDWKLVSLMIGNNDICSEMCYLKDPSLIVDIHYWSVRDALDFLRDNLPRTFVNVIPVTKVAQLTKMKFPKSCYLTHTIFCSCIFGPKFNANRDFYSDISDRLQQATIRAVADGGYGWKYDSFAAVTQPYLVNTLAYFTPSALNNYKPRSILRVTAPDCFHYCQFGYALTANVLWNNMLQPLAEKMDHHPKEVMETFLCPSRSRPFVFTDRNSANRTNYYRN